MESVIKDGRRIDVHMLCTSLIVPNLFISPDIGETNQRLQHYSIRYLLACFLNL